MEHLNKTNYGTENILNYFGTFIGTLYGCSLMTDILCITLIVLCRAQLHPVELCILLTYQAFTLVNKSFAPILLWVLYFNSFLFGNQTCIWTYPLMIAITIYLNFILVFYAFYHYSSIRRVKHRSVLYSLTRSVKFFGVFTFVTIVFSFSFSLSVFWMYRRIMIIETPKTCVVKHRTMQIVTLLGLTIVPLLVVMFVYTVSFYKLIKHIRKRVNTVAHNDKKRYRRLLKVSIKFFLFSLLPFVSCVVRFTFVAVAYICVDCHPSIFIYIQSFTRLINIVQPSLLIFIHELLKKKFQELLLKCLGFFPK